MSPQEYFIEFVEPVWNEYQQHPSSRRHAAVVAVVAYHMLEYIARDTGLSPEEVFDKAEQGQPYLGIIQQVADAFKHSERKRKHKGKVAEKVVTEIVQISQTYNAPWDNCL